MLVALRICGRWDGTKYVFDSPSVQKIYKGKVAQALGGGGGGTKQEYTPTGPWSQQIPYIRGLFGEAANLYNQGAPEYYPGSTVAPTNPNLAASQGQIQNTTGQTNNLLQNVAGQTAQNAQNGTLAGGVAQGQITPYNTAISGLLQSSLSNPTQSVAASALPAFYSGLSQASQNPNAVSTPQTQFGQMNANPALASSLYSNGMNPFTSQIVDAALRSSNRQFGENVIPQIATQANMAGQLGGTRQGVAEGIAAENQTQMQKDLIAQLFGQAFDVGSQERLAALGLVGQGQQANAQSSLQAQQLAEQQRQATMQSGLGQSQLVGGLLGQGQQLGQQGLSSAGQLTGNMLQTGSAQNLQSQVQNTALMPALTQAINTNLGLGNQVGLQQQAQDQALRDAAVEQWFYEQYAPYNLLTQYQNWITGPYGASADPYGGRSGAGNYVPVYQNSYPLSPTPSAPPTSTPTLGNPTNNLYAQMLSGLFPGLTGYNFSYQR